MQIQFDKLVALLEDAFLAGRDSSLDMVSQIVEEIIASCKLPASFKIYNVEELRKFEVGSKFSHSVLGEGEVANKKGLTGNFMKFNNGTLHSFVANEYPWDTPLLYLGGPGDVVK